MTRKMQKGLEKEISRNANNNPKKFWGYVKGKMNTKTGISDLIKNTVDGEEVATVTDQEKTRRKLSISRVIQQRLYP